MASAVEILIANQALVLLGAARITDFTDGSVNGNTIDVMYEPTKEALLTEYPWKFAIKRVALTADATAPIFGRARRFALPADYLSPLAPYPEDNFEELDWIIESGFIITDDSSPLNFRYIYGVTDATLFDPLFKKALAARLALEMCEQITQSNTKLASISELYERAITLARQKNAFEQANHLPPPDRWITCRTMGRNNTRSWG